MNTIIIEDAQAGDGGAIASIYAHHVLNGTATFDTEVLSDQDMNSKIIAIAARGWPFPNILVRGSGSCCWPNSLIALLRLVSVR